MIRAECDEGLPGKGEGKVSRAKGKVRGGWLTIRGKSGGGILVEETEITIIDSIKHCLPTIHGSLVKGNGIPGRIVGIEITKDKGVILEVKKADEIRNITRRAGGVRGKVEVDDIKGRPIVFHSDTINLHGAIIKVLEIKVGKLDICGDQEGYASSTTTLTVFPDEGIARKGFWL